MSSRISFSTQATRAVILAGLWSCGAGSDRPDANTSFEDEGWSTADRRPNGDPDGDGYTNSEEEEAGTNPDYEYSHPFTGDYRVGYCETPPEPTGPTMAQSYTAEDGTTINYNVLQNGDVPENFTMTDQYGEELNLYSFCGRQIMLVVSAGWCGPCRAEAETLQAVAEAHPEVQIITMLTQDTARNPASVDFVQEWAEQYGFINIAAVTTNEPAPTTLQEYFAQASTQWDIDGYLPTMYHLDSNMRVVSADEGVTEPPTL